MRRSSFGAAFLLSAIGLPAIAAPAGTPPLPAGITGTVTSMFTAAADGDQAGFERCLAPGFQVYEDGASMSGEQVFARVRQVFDHGGRIEWSVTDPRGRADGDLAAIQYVNQGAVIRDGVRHPVTWLETAALQRIDGRWRIMFMQSQRTRETAAAGRP